MFGYLIPPWAKVLAIVGAAMIAFGSGMWLEGTIKAKQIAIIQRDAAEQTAVDATAAITTLQRFISNMNLSAIEYGKNQDALFARLDQLKREFAKASALKPLPPGCFPDDVRMRLLETAVSAANSAAPGAGSGFGETVRTNP